MLVGLRQSLSHPAVGPIAIGVAFALALAFGAASSQWKADQARYETRIAELMTAAERTEKGLQTQLASCRTAPAEDAAQAESTREVAYGGPAPADARRLLERQPEGIDACARMESADQAVLSNLRK